MSVIVNSEAKFCGFADKQTHTIRTDENGIPGRIKICEFWDCERRGQSRNVAHFTPCIISVSCVNKLAIVHKLLIRILFPLFLYENMINKLEISFWALANPRFDLGERKYFLLMLVEKRSLTLHHPRMLLVDSVKQLGH